MSMWGILPDPLDRACQYYGNRTAVVDGDRRLTYRDLQAWTNQVANGLHGLGIGTGDRVGMLMPNSLEFVPTQHGVWKSGAALIQMPARASAKDLAYFLKEADASTLIYHSDFDETVRNLHADVPNLKWLIRLGGADTDLQGLDYGSALLEAPSAAPPTRPDPEDLAYIAFTSGTTGTPKGVFYSHRAWSHYIVTAGMEIADTRPGEVFAHGAPLTHYSGAFVLPTFIRGGTNVMLPGLDVDVLVNAIEREGVTATAVVPTTLYLLLDSSRVHEADLSTLQTMIYAGSPVAPDRLRQAVERFGPIFVQTYAGHEPGFMTILSKEDHRLDVPAAERRLESAGRAMFHVQLCVQNDDGVAQATGKVGEICSRSHGQMDGYLDSSRNSEAIRDGWIRSGDVGYLDEDGYVYLVDRVKDMIVTGGFNVFPRQIEDVLLSHPAIAQCAVFGIPDPKWGEAVKAVVACRSDRHATAEELIAFVKEHKGSVWAPKTVDFVDALPLNPSGKVDKKALRTPYWAGHQRSIS